jgi:hypothetical protein
MGMKLLYIQAADKYNSTHPLQLYKIFLLQGVAICDVNTEVGQLTSRAEGKIWAGASHLSTVCHEELSAIRK